MTVGVDLSRGELINVGQLVPAVISNKAIKNNNLGNRRSKILGQGMDFDQIRQYQFGDDIRSIDWKSSARLQKTYIKTYKEERQRPIFLLIDLNSSMLFASKKAFKSVIAARLATLFAFLALQSDDKIGAIIYSQNHHFEIKPKSPKTGINLLICKLVDLHKKALQDIDNPNKNTQQNSKFNTLEFALSRLSRVAKSGNLTIIISDFFEFNAKAQAWATRLSKRNQVLFNFVYDPLEQNPPKADDYWVSGNNMIQKMSLRSAGNRAIYRNFFTEKLTFLTKFCKNNKIQLQQISTTIDLSKIVPDL
ncbi:MAG: DUF58 domain-containing protein [Candidatus Thioglobus sp.]|nr:DUF58 domain-containing protein [Candidatus Thioglobus sp.]